MIYSCQTNLQYFYKRYEELSEIHGEVRWFSIGTLYFICDSNAFNRILLMKL